MAFTGGDINLRQTLVTPRGVLFIVIARFTHRNTADLSSSIHLHCMPLEATSDRSMGLFALLGFVRNTMVDKPASMYREISKPPYTRKEFITGIPGSKIAQHKMGDIHSDPDEYPVQLSLIVEEDCQLRHDALESARLSANRHLIKELGEGNYKMILRKFPHHVLRENKQATGAGADRVSDGMRQAFGRPVGSAARVSAGDRIFTIWCEVEQASVAKDALRRAYNKLSPPCRIDIERGEQLLIS